MWVLMLWRSWSFNMSRSFRLWTQLFLLLAIPALILRQYTFLFLFLLLLLFFLVYLLVTLLLRILWATWVVLSHYTSAHCIWRWSDFRYIHFKFVHDLFDATDFLFILCTTYRCIGLVLWETSTEFFFEHSFFRLTPVSVTFVLLRRFTLRIQYEFTVLQVLVEFAEIAFIFFVEEYGLSITFLN